MPHSSISDCKNIPPGPTIHSGQYNAQIAPIKRLGVSGVLWYHGETNFYDEEYYICAFPSMVVGWRSDFGNKKLPFYYVNLHPFIAGDPKLPQFRLVQSSFMHWMENVYMASAVDLGDLRSPYESIHPRNKSEVGKRLQLLVSSTLYGSNIQALGPVPFEAKLANTFPIPKEDTDDFVVKLKFYKSTVGTGLVLKSNECPKLLKDTTMCGYEFEMQFNDGVWKEAKAELSFDKTMVLLTTEYNKDAGLISLPIQLLKKMYYSDIL